MIEKLIIQYREPEPLDSITYMTIIARNFLQDLTFTNAGELSIRSWPVDTSDFFLQLEAVYKERLEWLDLQANRNHSPYLEMLFVFEKGRIHLLSCNEDLFFFWDEIAGLLADLNEKALNSELDEENSTHMGVIT